MFMSTDQSGPRARGGMVMPTGWKFPGIGLARAASLAVALVASLAMLALVAPPAVADDAEFGAPPAETAPATADAEAQPPAARVGREVIPVDPSMRISRTERAAAQAIARLALIDLRLRPAPTPDDYLVTALALRLAERVDPTEPAYTRHRLHAAYAAGDNEEVLDATRRLLRFDPSDTVAQLRLVSAQVSGMQTVEARLAAYDRLLGSGGRALAAEVRSRLALDAALLARETGDEAGFVRRLGEATALDPTNKEAASLAYTYFAERVDDPRGRVDLLMNLLIADPLDPNIHMWLANELAIAGAYRGARSFHESGSALLVASRSPVSQDQLDLQRLGYVWLTDGPQRVAEELHTRVAVARSRARTLRDSAEKGDFRLPEDYVPPEQLRLSLSYEWVRLFAADAAGDGEIRAAAARDFMETIADELNRMGDESRWPREATQAQMARVFITRLFEIMRLLAIFGGDESIFNSVRGTLAAFLERDPQGLELLEAWTDLYKGEHESALHRFTTGPGRGTVASLVASAIALERLGRMDEAGAMFLDAARADPAGQFGPWAISRARELGHDGPLTPDAPALEAIAQRTPSWVRTIARNPQQFFQLEIAPTASSALPTDPLEVRVRLRNLAPVAMGLGPGRALSSRFALTPRVEVQLLEAFNSVETEVFELDRRLALQPRESIELVLRPDLGYTGWLLDSFAHETVRLRWQGTLDFRSGQRMLFEPGFAGAVRTSDAVVRRPLIEARLTPTELIEQFATAPQGTLRPLVTAASAMLFTHAAGHTDLSPSQREDLVRAVFERYVQAEDATRLLIIAMMPHGRQVEAAVAIDRVVAEGEPNPIILAVGLLGRARSHENPGLQRAIDSDDPVVSELARLLRARLEAGSTVGYAFVGPELARIGPPRPQLPDAPEIEPGP